MGYYRRKPWHGGQAMAIAALAAALGSSSLAVCARAQAPESAAGIRFLNKESRREAVACGRSGADCAVKPYRLCPQNQRFSAWIATPFSRIAASVFESLEKGERPKPWDAGEANAWGAGIYVYPSG